MTLVNPFEVPANADDDFIKRWEATRDFLQGQAGYIDTQSHRSLVPNARFRFVNVAHWDAPQTFQQAIGQPEFREIAHMPHPAKSSPVRSRQEVTPDVPPIPTL